MAGVLNLLDQPRTLNALGNATSAIIYFYRIGTTVLAPIYSDAAMTIPAANPVILAAGQIFPDTYLDATLNYRRRIVFGDGTIHDIDPYPVGLTASVLAASTGASLIGTEYGMLDAVLDQLFNPTPSISVGLGGTFPTLVAALDYLQTQALLKPITVGLLEKNTPDSDSGSMAIPDTGYTFNHPNSKNVSFEGPAFGGGQGVITNAAMTGTKATDLAYCKTRYGASIRINGTDTDAATSAGGLAFPNGVGTFRRILFEERSRYSLDFGYNRSHANAKGFCPASFEDCAFFGSVWGIIGYNAHFSLQGQNWFGYQVNGGPIGTFHSSIEFVTNVTGKLRFYQPSAAATADGPKYCIFAVGTYLSLNSDGVADAIEGQGSFVNGLYAVSGSSGEVRGCLFTGVSQPYTVGDATINIGTFAITGSDPTKTAAVPGSLQPGVPGNSGNGVLIFAGAGGTILHFGGTITNSVAGSFVSCNGGNIKGWNPINVSGSKADVTAWRFASSRGNILAGTIGTPQVGSIDQSLCVQGADVFWASSSGFSFSPAINTVSLNGNGNYN